jgi:hypothetical protein
MGIRIMKGILEMFGNRERVLEISKMTKRELAVMHIQNGGLLGLANYMKWSHDELVNAVILDEAIYSAD